MRCGRPGLRPFQLYVVDSGWDLSSTLSVLQWVGLEPAASHLNLTDLKKKKKKPMTAECSFHFPLAVLPISRWGCPSLLDSCYCFLLFLFTDRPLMYSKPWDICVSTVPDIRVWCAVKEKCLVTHSLYRKNNSSVPKRLQYLAPSTKCLKLKILMCSEI